MKIVLASGREVNIRPLTWEAFWELGRMKVELAGADESHTLEGVMTIREKTLAGCVEGWEAIRPEVSLPEVLEMEKVIDKLSEAPVLEGNS